MPLSHIHQMFETHYPGWKEGKLLFPWPGSETFSTAMETLGFSVLQYATGQRLQDLRTQMQDIWEKGSKESISNQIEHRTFQDPNESEQGTS